jgi:hypothetical protein
MHTTRNYLITFLQEPFDLYQVQKHSNFPLGAIRGIPFRTDKQALTSAMLFTITRSLHVNLPLHGFAILPFLLYHDVCIQKTSRNMDTYIHPDHSSSRITGIPEIIWEIIYLGKESEEPDCSTSTSYQLAKDLMLNELRRKTSAGSSTSQQPYYAEMLGFAFEVLDSYQDCIRIPRRHPDAHVKQVTILHNVPPGARAYHILLLLAEVDSNLDLLNDIAQAVVVPAVEHLHEPLTTRLVCLGASSRLNFDLRPLELYFQKQDDWFKITNPFVPGLAPYHKLQVMYDDRFSPADTQLPQTTANLTATATVPTPARRHDFRSALLQPSLTTGRLTTPGSAQGRGNRGSLVPSQSLRAPPLMPVTDTTLQRRPVPSPPPAHQSVQSQHLQLVPSDIIASTTFQQMVQDVVAKHIQTQCDAIEVRQAIRHREAMYCARLREYDSRRRDLLRQEPEILRRADDLFTQNVQYERQELLDLQINLRRLRSAVLRDALEVSITLDLEDPRDF